MAPKTGADTEIDRLYAASPGEFVQRRDGLAGSLRKEGDREAAEEVKKLRKPTLAAWAVNQLARREKMRLRGLFTAGERLRAAHGELLAGGSPEVLERARDDERKAIDELVGAARLLLEEAGHPPTDAVLARVRETLHAAVVDEHVGERVRAGRLEKEEQAAGFGFTSLPVTSATGARTQPRRAPRARQERDREPARDVARQKQRHAEEAAREKRREAEERLRAARREVVDAERAVKDRDRELERARRELERRRIAVERAEGELGRAGPERSR